MTKPPQDEDSQNRIVAVTLDEESIGRSGPDIEHERAIAIYDLIEQNLFAPEAHHKALELTRTHAADVEYWPTHDPSGTEGNREQKLQAYREVCDTLSIRIRKRFAKAGAASG